MAPGERFTEIEKAAVELHEILWQNLGETDDWPLRIIYSDDETAERFCDVLNTLRNAIREKLPDHAPSPEPFG